MSQSLYETVPGKMRVLCSAKSGLLAYKNGYIGIVDEGDFRFRKLFKWSKSSLNTVLSKLRLTERLFRIEPRAACYFDGRFFVAGSGRLVSLYANTGDIEHETSFRDGMRAPLRFSVIEGVPGFQDCLVYGEYFSNEGRESVVLWRLLKGQSSWEKVHVFPAGSIRHIHGCTVDSETGCIYVLTGDEDQESGIWKMEDDFGSVERILGGTQQYRSCVGLAANGSLVYATDTPLSENYVYLATPNVARSWHVEPVCQLRGSCIYGMSDCDARLAVSTTIEPDSRLRGLRYLLSCKKAPGILDSSVDFLLLTNGEAKCLATLKKDCLPTGLFQFSAGVPVFGERGLYFSCCGLKGLDGRVVRFSLDKLNM